MVSSGDHSPMMMPCLGAPPVRLDAQVFQRSLRALDLDHPFVLLQYHTLRRRHHDDGPPVAVVARRPRATGEDHGSSGQSNSGGERAPRGEEAAQAPAGPPHRGLRRVFDDPPRGDPPPAWAHARACVGRLAALRVPAEHLESSNDHRFV